MCLPADKKKYQRPNKQANVTLSKVLIYFTCSGNSEANGSEFQENLKKCTKHGTQFHLSPLVPSFPSLKASIKSGRDLKR